MLDELTLVREALRQLDVLRGTLMRRARRYLLATFVIAASLGAASCRIPLGNGCDILIAEPGVQAGVACNF